MARVLGFLMLPFALAKPSLRAPDVYVDTVQCTGSGSLPTEPVCFGGSVLVENFNIHVTSYDGKVGTVNLEATGKESAACQGAVFENNNNVITIENDHDCGLSNYDYTVRYCPDQDSLIVNLVKPFNVRVVLNSESCAGEV